MENVNEIAQRCAASQEMLDDWDLIIALEGGTEEMREKGETYLPRETAESKADYDKRIARTFLYNGFVKAKTELLAKPFTKPVTVHEGLPPLTAKLEENCDREGTDLTLFARSLFDKFISRGIAHILVDAPPKAANAFEAERDDIRPYFVLVPPENLFRWRTAIRTGRRVVTEIVIRECIEDGMSATGNAIQQFRRITETTWEVYRQGKTDAWVLVESGVNTLGRVPIVTRQTDRSRFMVSESPLQGVADLNLAHWQSNSDQRNILRFARAPIIWRAGVGSEEVKEQIVVGAGASYASVVPGATMQFVEHSGAAIAAGRQDLMDLEDKMSILTLEPLL